MRGARTPWPASNDDDDDDDNVNKSDTDSDCKRTQAQARREAAHGCEGVGNSGSGSWMSERRRRSADEKREKKGMRRARRTWVTLPKLLLYLPLSPIPSVGLSGPRRMRDEALKA